MAGRGFVGDAAVSGGGVHVLVLAGDGPRFLPCRKFVLRLCFAFGLPARLGRLAFQTVVPLCGSQSLSGVHPPLELQRMLGPWQ